MGRECSTHGEKRNAYRILVGKPEGKRSLGRRRRRWKDNITMNRREIGWGGMVWIHLAQDRDQWRAVQNTVMNLGFHGVRLVSYCHRLNTVFTVDHRLPMSHLHNQSTLA
jgi:hypothetical protein